ncbi:hypothetical protein [Mycolicibacterium komossense]|uniref:PE-PGRS family protein n=1 Tax=Mycolicibacterium komossense TaxID=1779 RepID=A0ABT3CMW7_9MYCO|nr:hypothetical protein [Mycolicibacterium komossense]MCV7230792.1 hypothetical protein [Mycolicibacterium komossense]
MQVAVRSYLTAGVAMVGATALIASPISMSPPQVQIPAIYSAQVGLSATVDPITPWLNVVENALTNVAGIGTAVASDPAPALRQLITNWVGYGGTLVTGLTGAGGAAASWATETLPAALQAVAANLAQGNVIDAAQEVNNLIVSVLLIGFPLFDALAIPSQIVDSIARVVTALTSVSTVLPLLSGVLSPVMSVVAALGQQGQAVADALGTGDPLGALSAIINTPAAVTGAFLNGDPDNYPGLLTFLPYAPGAGLIGALLVAIPQAIAAALAPPATARLAAQTAAADVSAVPDATAATITLDAPTGTVIETPQTEVHPVSNVVNAEGGVTLTEVPTVVEQAAQETVVDKTPAGEVDKDAAPDPGIDAKDGNKAVPGEVNGRATSGSSAKAKPTQPGTQTETPSAVDHATPSRSASANAGNSDGSAQAARTTGKSSSVKAGR